MKALVTVLGPDGEDIVSSGDEVADAETRQKFVAAYDAKHQIAMEGDDKAIMVIGQEDFPLPIPLLRKDGMWRFDTAAGRDRNSVPPHWQERAGRYSNLPCLRRCAERIRREGSDRRQRRTPMLNASSASPESRTGFIGRHRKARRKARLASSSLRQPGRGIGSARGRTPYRGYYFKILTRQGPSAEGGKIDYVFHGRMIGGFALVAYPAEYRNSGVMTFIVNHAGIGVSEGPRAGHGETGGAHDVV